MIRLRAKKVGIATEKVYIDELASRALGQPPSRDLPPVPAAPRVARRPTSGPLVKRLLPRRVKLMLFRLIHRATAPIVQEAVGAQLLSYEQSERRLQAAVASLDVVVEDLRDDMARLQEELAGAAAVRTAVDEHVPTREPS